jgi:sugar-specific transcriptional regulator TrmB
VSLSSKAKLEIIESRTSETLHELGFGVHESSVIVALNQVETATVADLHASTGIHHANLYSVLDGLIAKGIVTGIEGRPKEFQFAPLQHLEQLLKGRVDQLIDDLQKLQDERSSPKVVPALIYTIRGQRDVLFKVQSMIEHAQDRIIFVGYDLHVLGESGVPALIEAARRGVVVKAILQSRADIEGLKLEQRFKEDVLATNLVVDGREAMIAVPDMSICGWADNTIISLQLEGFLDQTWNTARTK